MRPPFSFSCGKLLFSIASVPKELSLRGAKRRGNLLVQPIEKWRHDSRLYREIATAPTGPRNDTKSFLDFVNCVNNNLPFQNFLCQRGEHRTGGGGLPLTAQRMGFFGGDEMAPVTVCKQHTPVF